MKDIQIFEQFSGGHYTNYVQYLLPLLIELKKKGKINKVVVSITLDHLKSNSFREQLSPFAEVVEFDASTPHVSSELPLNPSLLLKQPDQVTKSLLKLRRLTSNLVDAVNQHRPDYLISTTADLQSMVLALDATLRLKALPSKLCSSGIFHYGYSGSASTISDRLKDGIYRSIWNKTPWENLYVVNPVIYESILMKDDRLKNRVYLVPDPVPSLERFEQKAARQQLGIPVDGKYIGFVGTMDHRVAIPDLLKAFNSANLPFDNRLLLAGRLKPEYLHLIKTDFHYLLNSRRLILIDRYLNSSELAAGYSAVDLVATLYYRKPNLSANLLKAVVSQKPVIVNDFGYTGMMVNRFDLGKACDVCNHQSIASAIVSGMSTCRDYRVTQQVERLIQFHHPDNYAATVLKSILESVGESPQIKTWDWVLDGSNF